MARVCIGLALALCCIYTAIAADVAVPTTVPTKLNDKVTSYLGHILAPTVSPTPKPTASSMYSNLGVAIISGVFVFFIGVIVMVWCYNWPSAKSMRKEKRQQKMQKLAWKRRVKDKKAHLKQQETDARKQQQSMASVKQVVASSEHLAVASPPVTFSSVNNQLLSQSTFGQSGPPYLTNGPPLNQMQIYHQQSGGMPHHQRSSSANYSEFGPSQPQPHHQRSSSWSHTNPTSVSHISP